MLPPDGTAEDRRRRAYQVGGRHARQTIAREDPAFHELLEKLGKSDIVVVRGQFDHVEWVLEALGLPHLAVEPEHLVGLDLQPR
jgi:hypothetical protein